MQGKRSAFLSVVLVNYNTKRLTSEALASVENQADEIIVVDNASRDGSVEMLQEWQARDPSRHLLMLNPENLGFAKANNQGFEYCKGKYVLLLNTDTLVPESALERIVDWMEQHPDYGGCGPKLAYPDGALQHSPCRDPNLWMFVVRFLGLKHLLPSKKMRGMAIKYFGFLLGDTVRSYLDPVGQAVPAESVESLSGAALMVRKCVIDQVGGLDEGYFMYLEDSEWCIRIRNHGWKLGFVNDVTILHYAGASYSDRSSKKGFRAVNPHSFRSIMRYGGQHFGWISLFVLRVVITISLLFQAIVYPLVYGWKCKKDTFVFSGKCLRNISVIWMI